MSNRTGTLKYTQGDLFASDLDQKVIPHIVNNVGAWGAGFVVPLGQKFPRARSSYLVRHASGCGLLLGDMIWCRVGNGADAASTLVAHMVAQDLGPRSRRVRYNALSRCMDEVAEHIVEQRDVYGCAYSVVAPKFGAGLAGGDWSVIEMLLEDCWLERGIDVEIFEYAPPVVLPTVSLGLFR